MNNWRKSWRVYILPFLLLSLSCAPTVQYTMVAVPGKIDNNKFKRMGVVDFENLTQNSNAGKTISRELEYRLVQSGVFQMVERSQIRKVMEEQKLGLTGVLDEATAAQVGNLLGVDAIITGTVSQFNVNTTNSPWESEGYTAQKVETSAMVSASIKVINSSTGSIVWADRASGVTRDVGYTDVEGGGSGAATETTVVVNTAETISPAYKKWWTISMQKGDEFYARVKCDMYGVNVWIASDPEHYYPNTYRKMALSTTLDFTAPESGTFYLYVQNTATLISKSISVYAYVVRTEGLAEQILGTIFASSTASKVKKRPKPAQTVLEETAEKVANDLYKPLVPHQKRMRVE